MRVTVEMDGITSGSSLIRWLGIGLVRGSAKRISRSSGRLLGSIVCSYSRRKAQIVAVMSGRVTVDMAATTVIGTVVVVVDAVAVTHHLQGIDAIDQTLATLDHLDLSLMPCNGTE